MFGGDEIAYSEVDGGYLVDENSDGTDDYLIDDQDFNFRDFNSNFVLRWEFRPGSLIYLVWAQSRNEFITDGRFDWQDDLGDLFGTHPHNVFLLKFNKWLSL